MEQQIKLRLQHCHPMWASACDLDALLPIHLTATGMEKQQKMGASAWTP